MRIHGESISNIYDGLRQRRPSDVFFDDEVGEGLDHQPNIWCLWWCQSCLWWWCWWRSNLRHPWWGKRCQFHWNSRDGCHHLKSTDHVQAISKFDIEIGFTNQGREVTGQPRDLGYTNNLFLQDDIYIALYVDPSSAIYNDFELPYCGHQGNHFLRVFCQGGITSEDVMLATWQTKKIYTPIFAVQYWSSWLVTLGKKTQYTLVVFTLM